MLDGDIAQTLGAILREDCKVMSDILCIDGVMLIFTHRDLPGLIGHIGTIFGRHGVNIAQMTVGRQAPGGEAIGILNLDSPPPDQAIQAVKGHPHISHVTVVKLPPAGELPGWLG